MVRKAVNASVILDTWFVVGKCRSRARSAAHVSRATCHVPRTTCRGFTYIGLLILIALIGVALAGTGIVFHAQSQREKEKELLFAGDQLRRAIGQYYERSPGADKRFPQSLEDLLLDKRYPATQRYLRRIYPDPMTGSPEWGLVRTPDQRIIGVYSRSEKAPKKTANFPARYAEFADKQNYSEWKFVYAAAPAVPERTKSEQTSGAPPGATETYPAQPK